MTTGSSTGARFAFAAMLLACFPVAANCERAASGNPPAAPKAPAVAPSAGGGKTLTLVGTTDLHGHIEALPLLSSFVQQLRTLRAQDGGVLLLDAGDYLQGTLDSNQEEGRVVVQAYRALGYDAVALGNHEFDFGPEGDVSPSPGVDLFGALRARISEAGHPVLSVNLVDARTRKRPAWRGLGDSVLVEVAGVRVGLVGGITEETPKIVMPAYFEGLSVAPLAPRLTQQAAALRKAGARLVVAMTHLGADCSDFSNPADTSSCKPGSELEQLTRALPKGSVDIIFGGHTHKAVAHRMNGIVVVQAHAYGRAFSRVDAFVPPHGPVRLTLHPPQDLCASNSERPPCTGAKYEGVVIAPDSAIASSIQPAQQRAATKRNAKVGVEIKGTVRRAFDQASDLGNLLSDLLLEFATDGQIAIMNGGGLRADLPPGPLSYGKLFETMPFDNRVARVTLTGAELASVLKRHVQSTAHGMLSVSGMRLRVTCQGGKLGVTALDGRGRPIQDDASLVIITSDYLATGGDGLFEGVDLTGRVRIDTETLLRDAFAHSLANRKQVVAEDPKRYNQSSPRLGMSGPRPFACKN